MREAKLGVGVGGRGLNLLASGAGLRVISDFLEIESEDFCVWCLIAFVGNSVLLGAGEFLDLAGFILLFRVERELALSRTFFTQVLGL